MGYFAARGGFERDIDEPGPSAGAGIIRAPVWELQQGKNGVNKSLCSAQREAKDAFKHQHGGNSELRITLRAIT